MSITPTLRYTHNAPDYNYLREGIQHPHYQHQFKNALSPMQRYPKLMSRYFQVSAKMTLKGLTPFVHAQNLGFRATRQFLETLSKRKGNFRLWRMPSPKQSDKCQTVYSQVIAYTKRHGISLSPDECDDYPSPLDETPEFRPQLLSMSYSLMDFAVKESAYDFLFSSSPEGRGISPECHSAISHSLKIRSLEKHTSHILKSLQRIKTLYERLEIGGLFVIGIPKERLKTYTYDSKAFGIPTGLDIREVVDNLPYTKRAFSNKLQARLLLCKETLSSESNIETVDIHDKEEVKRYCQDIQLTDPESLDVYAPIFAKKNSVTEEAFENTLCALDREVRALVLDTCH